MEPFEVAHALYCEEPVQVYYLDHAPAAAAQYHCDRHVLKGIVDATVLLSTAWHELHNPMYQDIDEVGKYDALFGHVVSRENADPFYGAFDSRAYWTLCRQKVAGRAHVEHPVARWVRAALGNYRWVHALGMALTREYTLRYGGRHAGEPTLWTLELAPPALEGAQTEPPPCMPEHCKVEVGGYWDTVASYRAYYVAEKQPLLNWTRRDSPPWLAQDKGGKYVLVD